MAMSKRSILPSILTFVVLSTLLLCRIAYSQTIDEAMDHYKSGNYDRAFSTAIPLAELGNNMAQYGVGLMYYQGKGAKKDIDNAIAWLKKSADQSNTDALNLLCRIYGEGTELAKNEETAFKYCLNSADLGDSNGQMETGYRYSYGIGVKTDDVRAVEFYMKSANQGNPQAQHNLGYMYFEGRGVSKSNQNAEFWYRKAAGQGSALSMRAIALMHLAGDIGFRDEIKALAWFILATKNGLKWIEADIDELSAGLSAQQVKDAEALASQCILHEMSMCD